jgi:predicted GH43/DUF377 family glycosyl hydrolase
VANTGARRRLKKPSTSQTKPVDFRKHSPPVLKKFEGNPIIAPNPAHPWKSRATFNPAAVEAGGRIHVLYRALGDDDLSVFGHASSPDGVMFDEHSEGPVYRTRARSELAKEHLAPYQSPSGGGFGGCEDPRATKIDGRVYVTYTEWNGWDAPRVALTSIAEDDFLKKKWKWKKPAHISPPNQPHKNWSIFPEKIQGKYAILHSIAPSVQIGYFDDLDFDGDTYIDSHFRPSVREDAWDSRIRGAGPPPLKTKDGWLVLYHATDDLDPGRYKIGAMLLDLEDPTKILYRAVAPILAPDEAYENAGFKSGVVYSCGAVALDDKLRVYYGGTDTVVCVAEADLDEFLKELKRNREPKLMSTAVEQKKPHAKP